LQLEGNYYFRLLLLLLQLVFSSKSLISIPIGVFEINFAFLENPFISPLEKLLLAKTGVASSG